MVNKLILIGRLAKDPEIFYSQSGMAVCKFTLVTSEKRKGKDEKTQFHRCTCFDFSAEFVQKYLGKGCKAFVEGRVEYGSYDKEGVKHYTTDIICQQVQALDFKNTGNIEDKANTIKTVEEQGELGQIVYDNGDVADVPF